MTLKANSEKNVQEQLDTEGKRLTRLGIAKERVSFAFSLVITFVLVWGLVATVASPIVYAFDPAWPVASDGPYWSVLALSMLPAGGVVFLRVRERLSKSTTNGSNTPTMTSESHDQSADKDQGL